MPIEPRPGNDSVGDAEQSGLAAEAPALALAPAQRVVPVGAALGDVLLDVGEEPLVVVPLGLAAELVADALQDPVVGAGRGGRLCGLPEAGLAVCACG